MKAIRRLVVCWFPLALLLAPAAQAAPEMAGDQVSFQVEADREVVNDRVLATLSIIAEGSKPPRLAQKINAAMDWALQQVRAVEEVTPRSGSYQTRPVYDDGRIVRWRAQQELQLESGDVQRLSELLGTLQDKLQVQSVRFSVAPETRRRVEDELVRQALKAFLARAETVRDTLGAKGYRLLDISIHTGGAGAPVPLRAEAVRMRSAAVTTAPVLEQGTSRVTVQVSGKIRLLR